MPVLSTLHAFSPVLLTRQSGVRMLCYVMLRFWRGIDPKFAVLRDARKAASGLTDALGGGS